MDSKPQQPAESVAGSVATAPSSCSQTFVTHATIGTTHIEEGKGQKVPFQQLIDNALDYMKAYPPRSLLKLARKYYQPEEWVLLGGAADHEDTTCELSTNIRLLQEAPTWSLVSTAPADWILKQRLRQDLGLKATSRKDRRRRRQQRAQEQQQQPPLSSSQVDGELSTVLVPPMVDHYYLKKHANDPAVIAAGFGPGPEAVAARRRRRKRLATALAVGFLAMTMGLVSQQYYSQYYYYDASEDAQKEAIQVLSTSAVNNNDSNKSTSSLAGSLLTSSVADFCKMPGSWFAETAAPADAHEEEEEHASMDSSIDKSRLPLEPVSSSSTMNKPKSMAAPKKASTTVPKSTPMALDLSSASRGMDNASSPPRRHPVMVVRWMQKLSRWISIPFRWILKVTLARFRQHPSLQQNHN